MSGGYVIGHEWERARGGTTPAVDGMLRAPNPGGFLNGMHVTVRPLDDGRIEHTLLWLNPFEHPWGYYDPTPFPQIIVAPRFDAFSRAVVSHARWLWNKPKAAGRRVSDAWRVLIGRAFIDDGQGW
jgi:hypothetical protein